MIVVAGLFAGWVLLLALLLRSLRHVAWEQPDIGTDEDCDCDSCNAARDVLWLRMNGISA